MRLGLSEIPSRVERGAIVAGEVGNVDGVPPYPAAAEVCCRPGQEQIAIAK
jgi:hypothetical protein